MAELANRERKVRDQWETGEIIPLPREVLDHHLSPAALQDRWVAGAERKYHALREHRQELLEELADVDEALKEAGEFVREAKQAQERYRQQEAKTEHRPAKVEALLTRRTPAQVAELLETASAQG